MVSAALRGAAPKAGVEDEPRALMGLSARSDDPDIVLAVASKDDDAAQKFVDARVKDGRTETYRDVKYQYKASDDLAVQRSTRTTELERFGRYGCAHRGTLAVPAASGRLMLRSHSAYHSRWVISP